MAFYRRRLPHFHYTGQPTFITWSLHSSFPPDRAFPKATVTSGEAFAAADRLLEETRTGSAYLRQPKIAGMVVEAIHYNDDVLSHYSLHSYAVMPNHVHILITPFVPLPKLTKSLKSITAKRANEMLMRTGRPFWQEESYDRLIRDGQEFLRIQRYIEWNPVRAGLVSETRDYPWSSVGAAGGPRAGQGPAVQPTTTNHREALNSMQKTKVNVRVRERKPLEDLPAVRELIRAAETAFGDTGRVMVEGPDQSQVDDYATRIATQIKQDLVG